MYMRSINVCGLHSKLKYGSLQDHIKNDLICLTETKCDSLIGYDIDGYNLISWEKKSRKHKYGGIHGVCILINQNLLNIVTLYTILNQNVYYGYI